MPGIGTAREAAKSSILSRLRWTWLIPLFALAVLAVRIMTGPNGFIDLISSAALLAAVFAAVHHAEVIAHWLGEPFGTLVLAIAITIIEVALIVSVMIAGGPDKAVLARDTVFATVMLVCNGIIGLCLLAGGMRHHVQDFHVEGARAGLAVLTTLTVLTLVLPNFTTSAPGPYFNTKQLIFVGIISLILYAAFVFVQTVRHRDYFLSAHDGDDGSHASLPNSAMATVSVFLLLISLVAVVGIAKTLTPVLEVFIAGRGIPQPVVGIVIAAVVLLPEGVAAFRAAQRDRLQTSMNLALGSALASIGLTIPAVAAISVIAGKPLTLGLEVKEEIFLALTLLLSTITLGSGRTTVLQGVVHLIILGTFLFVAIVP
jgi:Ca2+:H+ antiporter